MLFFAGMNTVSLSQPVDKTVKSKRTTSLQVTIEKRLKGFDEYMNKILKDWNIAGAGVGIVYKDKLVFAKGYGYRDYENKLPVTPNTLFQIASNTKLFTTVAVGLLVEQGKLDWDKPVRNYVPSIQFYNNELNESVTIRDMLAHRTGVSRHDLIWYKSDFTRRELFEKLRYLEPSQPIRQSFLYNNLMYVSTGYITELLSGMTWEDFVKKNLLMPLEMNNTVFTVKDMEANPDHGVPFNERRDTTVLFRIPIYEDQAAVGPAGCLISSIEDLSHWLIALMNNGNYNGKQVIPEKVLRATLEPSIALPNSGLQNRGYKEILNMTYGMGREYYSYRGHFTTQHGGALPGFYSQVTCMPYDSIGVIAWIIGDQGAPLSDIITYNVYERLLGMDQTPWSERGLKDQKEGKKIGTQGRKQAGFDHVAGTKPSHDIIDYAGQYENSAYGIVNISLKDTALQLDFHKIQLPLKHYHFDRFDTPNDEIYGLFSLNFITNPLGDIDGFNISVDEGQATFVRRPDAMLYEPETLMKYTGKYKIAGSYINVEMIDKDLYLIIPGAPRFKLMPVKKGIFKIKEYPDMRFEFLMKDSRVTGVRQLDPSGIYVLEKEN
jgi:CubicO group peptidase (beta-lactamase class C family)